MDTINYRGTKLAARSSHCAAINHGYIRTTNSVHVFNKWPVRHLPILLALKDSRWLNRGDTRPDTIVRTISSRLKRAFPPQGSGKQDRHRRFVAEEHSAVCSSFFHAVPSVATKCNEREGSASLHAQLPLGNAYRRYGETDGERREGKSTKERLFFLERNAGSSKIQRVSPVIHYPAYLDILLKPVGDKTTDERSIGTNYVSFDNRYRPRFPISFVMRIRLSTDTKAPRNVMPRPPSYQRAKCLNL